MATARLNVVTGAFSFTGQHITRRLLAAGESVIALTGRTNLESMFSYRVRAFPFNFDKPDLLTESLRGATTLYNTYWIRFARGQLTFDKAVENTKTLIRAAGEAGVRRIVHVSITNPSEASPFPYFRGKAVIEKAIIHSKLSYAIVRPTVIFGVGGILITNIAWLLRKFPVFAVCGSGDYRLQPVFVEDVAEIAVNAGHSLENMVVDAVGPEIYSFNDLVKLIAAKIRRRARIVHVSPGLLLLLAKLIGYTVKDVLITRDEIDGLMSGLLVSDSAPAGGTRLSEWLEENAGSVGAGYVSELKRHYL